MNKEFVSPLQKKRSEWYASLSTDQKKKIDELNNNNTDKSNYIIRAIKRKRNPIIKEGDIFAIQLPEKLYLFGRVLKAGLEDDEKKNNVHIIFIFNSIKNDINDIPLDFNYDSSVIGPELADTGFWSRGYFCNIINIPLTEYEKRLDYGFYYKKIFNGNYCDEYRNKREDEPKFVSLYGYVTLYGVSMRIREKIVLGEYVLL